jgi:hypothetical protein
MTTTTKATTTTTATPFVRTRLLTQEQVAWYTSYSPRTIRRWTSQGVLPHLGPRGRPRYRLADVEIALGVLAGQVEGGGTSVAK